VPKLPRISGKDAVKVFKKVGWEVSRQRGSHIIMTKTDSIYTLSVPDKPILAPGLLKDLINKASLSVDEFIDLL
jgi:predicted RNA binding protein YcfA (HicA-like mRNA interferase family)